MEEASEQIKWTIVIVTTINYVVVGRESLPARVWRGRSNRGARLRQKSSRELREMKKLANSFSVLRSEVV